jgi:hypothetical protein
MPVGRGRSGKQGVPGAWHRIVSVYRLIKTFDFTSCRQFRMISGEIVTDGRRDLSEARRRYRAPAHRAGTENWKD